MSGRFADLRTRLLSAAVMIALGLGALLAGGYWFLLLVSVLAGLMLWELIRMLGPHIGQSKSILLAAVGAASVLRAGIDTSMIALSTLFIAPFIGLVLLRRDRAIFVIYAFSILVASAALFWLRVQGGLDWPLWLVLVVIASDVGGYFFGRIIGGPKILPRISPKKTWSGTLGGWLLAALVGLGFAQLRGFGTSIVVMSVLTAIAAQAGDVAESAVKRHVGVKDASALIPGHGGVLDRFDAMIGASLFVLLWLVMVGAPAAGAY